jgi:hypothetical protein
VYALGAQLSHDEQWANLLASMDWLNAHPLSDSAPPDTVATRNLVLAALVKAQNALQGGDPTAADTAYAAADQAYRQYAAQQHEKETPSGLALWLSGLGIDLASPIAKYATLAAVGLVALLVVPPVLTRALTPQLARANRPRRRRRG